MAGGCSLGQRGDNGIGVVVLDVFSAGRPRSDKADSRASAKAAAQATDHGVGACGGVGVPTTL
jgi:hypothetical protein